MHNNKHYIFSVLVLVVAISCVCVIGFVTHDTNIEHIHPLGQLVRGHTYETNVSEIQFDEMIYVAVYPECEGENMLLIDGPIKISYDDGTTIWHWLYTCKYAEATRGTFNQNV